MNITKRVFINTILIFGSTIVSVSGSQAAVSFSGPTNFTVGFSPFSVAVGDFNGDGKQDLAMVNNGHRH